MEYYSVLSEDVIQQFKTRYPDIAKDISKGLFDGRAAIYFIGRDGFFVSDDLLSSDKHLKFDKSSWDDGLVGLAVKECRVQAWPDDAEALEAYRDSNPGTGYEAAVPVVFGEGPTGVILINFQVNQTPSVTLRRRIIAELENWGDRVALLVEREAMHRPAIEGIRRIVSGLKTETQSKAGYVAFLTPRGEISYITDVGDEKDVFLRLNVSEGLTGRVFLTGQEIISPDVWEEPDYVASDQDIRSEILLPIAIGGRTFAVLNMEATGKDHYRRKYEESCRAAVVALQEHLELLSATSSYSKDLAFNLMAFLERAKLAFGSFSLKYDGSLRNEAVSFLEESLIERFSSTEVFVCNGGTFNRNISDEIEGAVWHNSIEEGVRKLAGEWVAFAPLRIRGKVVAVFGIRTQERGRMSDAQSIGEMCRIVELEHAGHDEAAKLISAISALADCAERAELEISLQDAVSGVTEFCEADACTILAVREEEGEKRLYPIVSSSPTISSSARSKSYYVAEDTSDGLTAFCANFPGVLAIHNVESRDELRSISPDLKWMRRLAEDEHALIRSFVGCAIRSPRSGALLGVVRAHRVQSVTGSPFSDRDRWIFGMVAKTLASTHEELLTNAFN